MNSEKEEISAKRWRNLGFYYEFDESTQEECIWGDRNGIKAFIEELRSYGTSKNFSEPGAHDHIGPYMGLELRTCLCSGLEEGLIHGMPGDFLALACEVEEKLRHAKPSECMKFDTFGGQKCMTLKVVLKPDGFDPSSMDRYAK